MQAPGGTGDAWLCHDHHASPSVYTFIAASADSSAQTVRRGADLLCEAEAADFANCWISSKTSGSKGTVKPTPPTEPTPRGWMKLFCVHCRHGCRSLGDLLKQFGIPCCSRCVTRKLLLTFRFVHRVRQLHSSFRPQTKPEWHSCPAIRDWLEEFLPTAGQGRRGPNVGCGFSAPTSVLFVPVVIPFPAWCFLFPRVFCVPACVCCSRRCG